MQPLKVGKLYKYEKRRSNFWRYGESICGEMITDNLLKC